MGYNKPSICYTPPEQGNFTICQHGYYVWMLSALPGITGAIINFLSFSHPHVKSLEVGLWGFPPDKQGINMRRWKALQPGIPVLVYGEYQGKKGIWLKGTLTEKMENQKPVSYWVQNPTGYPYQIKLELAKTSPESSNPVTKEELASTFNLGVARQKLTAGVSSCLGKSKKA